MVEIKNFLEKKKNCKYFFKLNRNVKKNKIIYIICCKYEKNVKQKKPIKK